MLVDTPGLGSLAKRGAAETLAYLPSCDLALLLIDAGATLNEEGKNADLKQVETDLDRLVRWNAEQAPNLKAESA